jgi:hypothetical protein
VLCFLSISATHFPRALCTKCRQNCAVYNDSLTNCPAADARLSHLMTVPCTVVGEKSVVFLRRSRRALILRDPKGLHCFVHKDQPVGHILTWFNPVLLFIPYFSMIHFDIIGQSTPRFYNFVFQPILFYGFTYFFIACYIWDFCCFLIYHVNTISIRILKLLIQYSTLLCDLFILLRILFLPPCVSAFFHQYWDDCEMHEHDMKATDAVCNASNQVRIRSGSKQKL